MKTRKWIWLLTLAGMAWTLPSLCDEPRPENADHPTIDATGQAVEGHGDAHGADREHGHGPGEINWFYGFFGEKEGVPASLLWRPKGMPPPFGAMLLNTAILFYVLGRFAGPKVSLALGKRKASIMQGMDDAAKMKEDAARRLSEYEQKLESIDDEIERVKKDMRETGVSERARILAEAKERRTRMERDARVLLELELKAAREELIRQTVQSAVRSAEDRLVKQVTVADQQRIAEHYLKSIAPALGDRR